MGRKADAIHCMGKLWEHNFHIYPIAATNVHCSIFHRFPISADMIFSSPTDSPYDYYIKFNLNL